MLESMLSELQQEATTTRRLLERVPADRLSRSPHKKSMSLGQLALHVASIPGNLSQMAQCDVFDAANVTFDAPAPASKEEVLAALDAGVSSASQYLGAMKPETAAAEWRLTFRGQEVFTQPRAGLLRSFMLNHWYHHRGQLSVYLRLLDVSLPVIYGRSADENPFA